MNERNFASQAAPETAMAPGHPAPDAEPDWLIRDRVLTEMATRYARLMAWVFALLGALLFFAIAASLASAEFGIAPPSYTGGEELFSKGSADPVHNRPDVAP